MPTDELAFLSVAELAKRVQSKKLSPVELTKYFLDRSEKLGPKFNAYARLTPDIALAQASAAEKEIKAGHYRGPLHGIPYAAKDLLAVRGVPTTWGAKPYANQVFDYDAAVIEHLNRAGAVLLGKSAMIELAGGMGYRFASASLQGEAKNPWDTKCWTCGSSSGAVPLAPPPTCEFTRMPRGAGAAGAPPEDAGAVDPVGCTGPDRDATRASIRSRS